VTRGPLLFKETDVKRVVKSAKDAGLQITRVEVTKAGSILVHVGKDDNTAAPEVDKEWDRALGQ
jgi:hypothetical protein